jgi:hypothetical protein
MYNFQIMTANTGRSGMRRQTSWKTVLRLNPEQFHDNNLDSEPQTDSA